MNEGGVRNRRSRNGMVAELVGSGGSGGGADDNGGDNLGDKKRKLKKLGAWFGARGANVRDEVEMSSEVTFHSSRAVTLAAIDGSPHLDAIVGPLFAQQEREEGESGQTRMGGGGGGGCPIEEECITTGQGRPCSMLKRVRLFRTPPVLPGQTRLRPNSTSAPQPRDTGNPLTEVSVGIRVFIALVHKVTAIPSDLHQRLSSGSVWTPLAVSRRFWERDCNERRGCAYSTQYSIIGEVSSYVDGPRERASHIYSHQQQLA